MRAAANHQSLGAYLIIIDRDPKVVIKILMYKEIIAMQRKTKGRPSGRSFASQSSSYEWEEGPPKRPLLLTQVKGMVNFTETSSRPDGHWQSEFVTQRRIGKRRRPPRQDAPGDRRAGQRVEKIIGGCARGRGLFRHGF